MTVIVLGERFWSKVDKTPDCWNWTAAKSDGYGIFGLGPRNAGVGKAHRLAYESLVGPIPSGMDLDHQCRNRGCVNPAHLKPATRSENVQNYGAARSDSKSGIRGVWWSNTCGKWTGQVCVNGVKHSAGYFDDLADASRAVLALRRELHTNNLTDRETA